MTQFSEVHVHVHTYFRRLEHYIGGYIRVISFAIVIIIQLTANLFLVNAGLHQTIVLKTSELVINKT